MANQLRSTKHANQTNSPKAGRPRVYSYPGCSLKMQIDSRRREEDPLTAQPKGYHGDHGDGCYRAWTPPEEER